MTKRVNSRRAKKLPIYRTTFRVASETNNTFANIHNIHNTWEAWQTTRRIIHERTRLRLMEKVLFEDCVVGATAAHIRMQGKRCLFMFKLDRASQTKLERVLCASLNGDISSAFRT